MESYINSNGNIFDVIDYNKLIYILNSKRLNKYKNIVPFIQTKKGIIYGNFVHVFAKCQIHDCEFCIKYNIPEKSLIQAKFISKL